MSPAPPAGSGPSGSGVLRLLKEGCREAHMAIERVVPLQQPGLTGSGYRDHLARLLGFYEPLEAALGAQPWSDAGLDFEPRRKSGLLAADLEYLGLDAPTRGRLPRCATLPPLAGLPEAFGCAYVLEGATRGGRVLAKHLGASFGLDRDHGCAFLLAYGDDGDARWAEFRGSLEAHVRGPDAPRTVAAAQETFAMLHRWLDRSA
jgi:heme oxygenase